MSPEQPAQKAQELSLACALVATQHQGNLALLDRILHPPCNPSGHVSRVLLVAGAKDIKDMPAQQRPLAWLRLDSEASP